MKNEKGSTIVTAIVIAMILTVLLGTILLIANSYHNRSLKNNQDRQAYLTAKSIVDTISKQIAVNNDDFIPAELNQPMEFPEIELSGDTCEQRKATITLEQENVIVIVGIATNFGQTQEIQLTMKKDSDKNEWQNLQYSNKGETVYETE